MATVKNPNMLIYEQSRAVPNEAKKQFNNGKFSGTDISPMWRIKKLTELFGPCGVGWYYDVLSERSEQHHDTTMAIVDLNLYIKTDGEWSKPIFGTGGNTLVKTTRSGITVSDEGYKMALTDALSVACKALGIGADVYWDRDTTKYTQGSSDTAQDVGEAKLKEMDAKLTKVNVMATHEQLAYIREHASDELYTQVMQHYGAEMERLTEVNARAVIKRIDNALHTDK
jgi:hypothetical protein